MVYREFVQGGLLSGYPIPCTFRRLFQVPEDVIKQLWLRNIATTTREAAQVQHFAYCNPLAVADPVKIFKGFRRVRLPFR